VKFFSPVKFRAPPCAGRYREPVMRIVGNRGASDGSARRGSPGIGVVGIRPASLWDLDRTPVGS